MIKKISVCVILCLLMNTGFGFSAKTEFCDLAEDISKQASKTFKTDNEKGIKLFLKAEKMCDSAQNNYNLGIAFYKYNNLKQAESYLKKAVEKQGSSNAVWLNNLAFVLLENRSDIKTALKLAQKAVKQDEDFFGAHDTLARAQFINGDQITALKTIHNAAVKWSSEKEIQKTRKLLFEQYTANCLREIKNNNVDKGLSDLKKADFDATIASTYCNVLLRLGKYDTALAAVMKYQGIYKYNSELKSLKQTVISTQIKQFYLDFQSGKDAIAVQQAKSFSEKHSDSKEAKKAYDELFAALIDDTKTLEVPKSQTIAKSQTQNNDSGIDTLMSSIGSSSNNQNAVINLKVDIEHNIPKGKLKNKYGIALLIGNQNYKSGLPDVKYAKRDVAVMKQYIIKTLGYIPDNVIVRTNVTSGGFRTLLGNGHNSKGKLHDYVRQGKSDVFIYYVGHGGPGPEGKANYLVPVDAEADYIQNNGYPLNDFYVVVKNLGARNVTIVLDACFSGDSASGSLFKNISPAMVKTKSPIQSIAKAAIFCAADKDQVATWYPSKRHSLFSYYFLKGIGGEADVNNDKIIRLNEMRSYLASEVKYQAGRESGRVQTPLVSGDDNIIITQLQ